MGKRLFKAKSEGALVHQILAGAQSAPHERAERVPEVISRACMRALSLYRDGRYPTAAAFAMAFSSVTVVGNSLRLRRAKI